MLIFVWQSTKTSRLVFFFLLINDEVRTTATCARCLLIEGGTMELSDAYIQSFIQPRNELLLEMEAYAEENHVPIMQLAGIDALNQLLRIQNPQKKF